LATLRSDEVAKCGYAEAGNRRNEYDSKRRLANGPDDCQDQHTNKSAVCERSGRTAVDARGRHRLLIPIERSG
jgi:hypothetical protein